MKHQRNGQALVLSQTLLEELLNQASSSDRLLFSICYYTSCRISEALQLKREDIIAGRIIFRAATTKTKKTREIKISAKLNQVLANSKLPDSGYLFLGINGKHRTRQSADLALRKICARLGIVGASTHSFRRTGLTKLYRAGVPLATIQQRSGHASGASLAFYIDIDRDEVDAAGELL